MTDKPFGGLDSASLVDETAITTGQTDLILTREQFDKMDAHVRRRFAAEFDGDVNGKDPHYRIAAAIAVQRTLSEYVD
jgi:hypothetical protein